MSLFSRHLFLHYIWKTNYVHNEYDTFLDLFLNYQFYYFFCTLLSCCCIHFIFIFISQADWLMDTFLRDQCQIFQACSGLDQKNRSNKYLSCRRNWREKRRKFEQPLAKNGFIWIVIGIEFFSLQNSIKKIDWKYEQCLHMLWIYLMHYNHAVIRFNWILLVSSSKK